MIDLVTKDEENRIKKLPEPGSRILSTQLSLSRSFLLSFREELTRKTTSLIKIRNML